MGAFINRISLIGAFLLVTAMLFTGSVFAQQTLFTVTKGFSDDNGKATAQINVTCSNGATATAQGDGTLANDESQDWEITNITTNTRCRAREYIPAGHTGSTGGGPQGSCESGTMVDDDHAYCTITNTLNTDSIQVLKQSTDDANLPVDVRM